MDYPYPFALFAANSKPVVSGVVITPGNPTRVTPLTCTPLSITDADGDAWIEVRFRWEVRTRGAGGLFVTLVNGLLLMTVVGLFAVCVSLRLLSFFQAHSFCVFM